MKEKKTIVTAVLMAGSLGLGAQTIFAQGIGGNVRPGENPVSESQFEAKGGTLSDVEIQHIKAALKAKGHNPGPMNGQMDNQTQQALREFQQKNNLKVTGTVDEQTAAKLGVTLGKSSDRGGSAAGGARSSTGASGSMEHGTGNSSSDKTR